jgi:tRNA(Arg) A34 adenosine deaminase TadA
VSDTEKDDGFMRRAIALSRIGMDEGAGPPFGALIVRNGAIIAEGYNLSFQTNDPTSHAEIVAIRRACEAIGSGTLTDCTLYTSAEPCPMCLGAIYWSGLAKVYYGNDCATVAAAGFDDRRLYHEMSLPASERSLPMVQRLDDEARQAFEAWHDRVTDGKALT